MAGFASLRRAVGTAPRHALIEFAMMDILMAGGAGPIFEMERQDFILPSGGTDFVAIGASNGGMRAGQRKTRLAMFGDRESGAVKIQNGMTLLAFVTIRRGFKLSVMGILMAVGAGCEFHLVDGVLARWQMALVAFHFDVLALQRVLGCVVLFHAEQRGLPAIHGVAFRALALFGTCFELALVGVRFMTIIAITKRKDPFEITLQMALSAADHGVLSEKRVLSLGMVEFKSRQQFFPSVGCMTFFAALLEGAFVRID